MPKSPTINEFKRRTARRLRRNGTGPEKRLWHALKCLELHGSHFRRQMPIGNFIVDFACPGARLVVEVDGSQHGDSPGIIRDKVRTAWLESQGYRVLRFWNNDVTQNIGGVLEVIHLALYGTWDAVPHVLKHRRYRRSAVSELVTPPRRAEFIIGPRYARTRWRADPPPAGEGGSSE